MTSVNVGDMLVFQRLVMSSLVAKSICVITSLKDGGRNSVFIFRIANGGESVKGKRHKSCIVLPTSFHRFVKAGQDHRIWDMVPI